MATEPVAGVLSAGDGTAPPPEVKTEITKHCNPMRIRLAKIYGEDFAKVVGLAAKEKFGPDDAVIVECEKHLSLTDEQLKDWVENEIGVHP